MLRIRQIMLSFLHCSCQLLGDPQRVTEDLSKKIFVGGLSPSVESDDLWDFFEEKYGPVLDAVVIGSQSGDHLQSRGFGFVTFKHVESVAAAVEAHYINIFGKKVEIKSAVPRSELPALDSARSDSNIQEQYSPLPADKMSEGSTPSWLIKFRQWLPTFLAGVSTRLNEGEWYPLSSLKGDFRATCGLELDHLALGYEKLSDFIRSLPEVCRMKIVPVGRGPATHMVLLPALTRPTPVSQSQGRTTWRLNVHSFRPPGYSPPSEQSPKYSVADCLKKVGGEKGIDEYYRQQAEMLDSFVEMDCIAEKGGYIPSTTQEERAMVRRGEKLAIQISNCANLVIFAAKVYACVRSGSLAIIASTLDSLLDLLSGFILWFTAISMRKLNPYLYPIGKKRMQPLGILVFASVMATLGLQVVLESIRSLISHDSMLDLMRSKYWVVGIMVGTSFVKFLLMVYCRMFSNEIVRAYAQDHFFDVVTNLIGLVAAVLATMFAWWIDPAGAIVLAIYTMRTWSLTVLENVNALVSRTASPDFLQKLTYLCWNHHKEIRQIDTVRAYTFGSHYFAEVDIVLPSEMPLHQAHDIGESLQNKLESLPEIERAFVHLDYEVNHPPEHASHDD
ncbi:unnamed protein product [Sphagnum balticum]